MERALNARDGQMSGSGGGFLLVAGGIANFAVAALHLRIVFLGPAGYRYFGAGEHLATMAQNGSALPALVTIALAVCFALFGYCALSGAGVYPRLPLLRWILLGVGIVYTLRGLLILVELGRILSLPGTEPARELVFSAVALIIGLLYLVGLLLRWNQLREAGHVDLPSSDG
jgi:hypothetical protein